MRANTYTQCVLTAIALLLGMIALRPTTNPVTVHAQSDTSWIYVEPRTTMLRKPNGTGQMQGKVFIDLRTGDIWGFPTLSDAPYPVDTTKPEPPVSEPMYLGKFDLSKMKRSQ
ncbi:MAG TPA: hypothetical protein VMS37_17895 [Verrucomicrobiae bacterium]|nr:hypothetical protein [Verrucomicrobiae bacterium]